MCVLSRSEFRKIHLCLQRLDALFSCCRSGEDHIKACRCRAVHMKHTAKYTVIVFCLKATAELIRENVGLQKEL